MTNAVVVYDNNDLELGDFFCSCVDSLDELFEKSGINPIKLGSSEVNTSLLICVLIFLLLMNKNFSF